MSCFLEVLNSQSPQSSVFCKERLKGKSGLFEVDLVSWVENLVLVEKFIVDVVPSPNRRGINQERV